MMMSRRALAIGAVVASSVLGVACSSGSGGTSASTVGPSTTSASTATAPSTSAASEVPPAKAAFLAQGNAICRKMNDAQVAHDARPESQVETDAALATLLNRQADIIASALQQLQALAPPPGDEATIADIFAKVQTFIDLTRRAAVAVTDGTDTEWTALVDQMDEAVAAANTASNAYGLYDCGRDDLSTSTA